MDAACSFNRYFAHSWLANRWIGIVTTLVLGYLRPDYTLILVPFYLKSAKQCCMRSMPADLQTLMPFTMGVTKSSFEVRKHQKN